MYTAQYSTSIAPCNHCSQETNISLHGWIDIDYRDELIGRGINKEEASKQALASAIRHQRKTDAQPFVVGYLCPQHLLEATREALRFDTITPALVSIYSQFAPGLTLVIFDKNHEDGITSPTASVGRYRDIHHFKEVYTQLDKEGKI